MLSGIIRWIQFTIATIGISIIKNPYFQNTCHLKVVLNAEGVKY